MKNIRLLLLDDRALFRESLARLLQAEPGFEAVAHCSSGTEALKFIKSQEIDIVLLDRDLGEERGADFLGSLHAERFKGRVLLVTAGLNESDVPTLIRNGTSGVFMKHGYPAELVQGIRETMDGKALFRKDLLRKRSKAQKSPIHSRVGFDSRKGSDECFHLSLKAWPTSRFKKKHWVCHGSWMFLNVHHVHHVHRCLWR